MWKLWHKLFGWEYIAFNFADSRFIARVHYTPLGDGYVNYYGMKFVDEQTSYRNWKWLTPRQTYSKV